MSRCVIPGCEGHLGKFSDCLSEALWSLGEMYADESGGGSSSPAGYAMLFCFDKTEWLSSIAKGMFAHLSVPDFTIGAGTYVILTEFDSGQVFTELFDNRDDAVVAYDRHDRAFGEWSEVNEY